MDDSAVARLLATVERSVSTDPDPGLNSGDYPPRSDGEDMSEVYYRRLAEARRSPWTYDRKPY